MVKIIIGISSQALMMNNKDKIKIRKQQKYTCECGSILTKYGKSRYETSEKHINFVKHLQTLV